MNDRPPENEADRQASEREQRAFTEQDILRFRAGPGVNPEKVPRREPGDGWIILGLFVGAVVGAVAGWAAGDALGLNPFIALVVGVVVGGVAGTLLGDRFKKSRARPPSTGGPPPA